MKVKIKEGFPEEVTFGKVLKEFCRQRKRNNRPGRKSKEWQNKQEQLRMWRVEEARGDCSRLIGRFVAGGSGRGG